MCTWPPPFLQKAGRAAGQHSGFSASRWWMWKIPVRGPNVVSLKPDDSNTSKVTESWWRGEPGTLHSVPSHLRYPGITLLVCAAAASALSATQICFHAKVAHLLVSLPVCLPAVLLEWLLCPQKQVCIPACVCNLVNKGMSLCPAASFSGGFTPPYLWLLSLQLTRPSDPAKTLCPQAGGDSVPLADLSFAPTWDWWTPVGFRPLILDFQYWSNRNWNTRASKMDTNLERRK